MCCWPILPKFTNGVRELSTGSVTDTLATDGQHLVLNALASTLQTHKQRANCLAGSVTDTLSSSAELHVFRVKLGHSHQFTTPCKICVAGSVTNTLLSSGGSTCTQCDAGQYSPNSQTACQIAPLVVVNTLSSSGGSTCTP